MMATSEVVDPAPGIRVIVSYGESHRSYREVIAEAIRESLPGAESVTDCGLCVLWKEISRLDPHVVVCEEPNTAEPGRRPAWVELPVESESPARISIDGRVSEVPNPSFGELLAIVDRAARSVANGEAGGC